MQILSAFLSSLKKYVWPLPEIDGFPLINREQLIGKKNPCFIIFIFTFFSYLESIVPAMKQLLETPVTGLNPLCKLWFHCFSGCWCRSQTAIGLTHILAFCVYIRDDDVCKQQGKNPVFISTVIPAIPFPPQLHQQSLGMWPEPQFAVGNSAVVTILYHSAPQSSLCIPDLQLARPCGCQSPRSAQI